MKSKGENVFLLLLFFAFCAGLYLCRQWPSMSRLYPTITLSGGIIFSGALLILQFFGGQKNRKPQKVKEAVPLRNELIMVGWVIGYLAIVLIFGYWVAAAIFPLLFLSIFGHENWKIVSIYSVVTCITVYVIFGYAIRVFLYGGVLRLSF